MAWGMSVQYAFDRFALDFANRTVDADGRLHVAVSNISKATVNPYYGREIPNAQALGLEPNRVYKMLRDPLELERGADSFNRIQLMVRHVPVSVDEPKKDLVVGATGESAAFSHPYLQNSLAIWDAKAIAGVISGDQRELSCCYRYDPDMTPGVYDGLAYDGIMRNIVGNHVALVETGRAGSDVFVGDSKLETGLMATKLAILEKALAGKLAADAVIDTKALLLAMDEAEKDCAKAEDDDDETEEERKDREACEAKASSDKKKARDKKAKDEDPDDETEEECEARKAREAKSSDKRKAKDKAKDDDDPAMDAALNAVRASTIKQMNDRDAAKELVRPYVGPVFGMDSAEDVYRFALKTQGVDLTDIHPSAFAAILKMLPKPGSAPSPRVAMDSAGNDDFDAFYPGASTLNHA